MLDTKLLPPGPDEAFDLSLTDDLLGVMTSLFEQYGDLCRVYSPVRETYTYIVSHPDYVRHVLQMNNRNYVKGLGIDRVKILLGNGIMVSEGDYWRQQRRMIQPAFHHQVIAQMARQMEDANREMLAVWAQKARQGERINLNEAMSEVTLNIVLKSLFSADVNDFGSGPDNIFHLLTEETGRNLQFAMKFRALRNKVMELVERRRKNNIIRMDFLSMLMGARDKDTNRAMSDKELLDEVMTLVVAGHETTASSLTWTWYLLGKNPVVYEKLRREIDEVLEGRAPQFADLGRLTYTRQVIEESLRMYPPGWLLTRRALNEDTIGGYHVPAHTDIFLCPYLVHRHTGFWRDPHQFDPDRFAPEHAQARPRFAYFPFAAGPRQCIGDYFAMVEMQFHLAMVTQQYTLQYMDERPVELEPQVNLRSRHPLFVTLQSR